MTQPILRVLIQKKLADGRLPRTQIARIWGGPPNGKGLLRGLTLAALAVLGTMTCVASAGAATQITSCGSLNTPGATYVLANDLSSCESCLVVNADRITIDLGIYAISGILGGCADSAGITDGGTARQGTTVKNGTISGFTIGVDLGSSTRNQILNLTSSANSVDGIVVGDRSLVKGSLIAGNGQDGIAIRGSFGQVQDCTIGGSGALEGNARFGIWGGSHQLITRNTVVGNKTGIVVGFFSTVSFNTSSYNTVFGVSALDHSLITGNTTIGNGPLAGIATGGLTSVSDDISNGNGDGGTDINVQCPSTVTNNQASGHMSSYDFNGPPSRCQTKNNK